MLDTETQNKSWESDMDTLVLTLGGQKCPLTAFTNKEASLLMTVMCMQRGGDGGSSSSSSIPRSAQPTEPPLLNLNVPRGKVNAPWARPNTVTRHAPLITSPHGGVPNGGNLPLPAALLPHYTVCRL